VGYGFENGLGDAIRSFRTSELLNHANTYDAAYKKFVKPALLARLNSYGNLLSRANYNIKSY
jgi:hypothetical protein